MPPSPLDEALAAGRLSKMGYLLARMRQAEADAERIISASPQGSIGRAELAYDQRARAPRRYHD